MPVKAFRTARYTRKSFFVDAKVIGQAHKALGAETDAEAVRLSLDRVVEMERFWRFMTRTRKSLSPGSFDAF
jgi:hypothetical protein